MNVTVTCAGLRRGTLAGVVLSPGAVTRVEELVERLDELPCLSELVVALTL